jgi:hypothetical protein
MAGVFQNIDPPPPSLPGDCVPPAFDALARRREGCCQYFGRRQTQLCTLRTVCKYFVSSSKKIKINCLELATRIRRNLHSGKRDFCYSILLLYILFFPCPASGGAESSAEGPGPALRVERAQQGREEKVRRLGRRGGQKPHRR